MTVHAPGCEDGELRLVDGPNVREGRLEICINRAWGTVCNEQFGRPDAAVVCKQMGFSENGMYHQVMCLLSSPTVLALYG